MGKTTLDAKKKTLFFGLISFSSTFGLVNETNNKYKAYKEAIPDGRLNSIFCIR